jgi:SAM-dependent methyltransferase
MTPEQDAYGRALLDLVEGIEAHEIIERDDGLIEESGGRAFHLAPYHRWLPAERKGLRWVRGRVLDVGAGAGRVSLHLQEKGYEVVATDISPLAIEACRRRGVRDARVVAVEDIDSSLGTFDTVLFYGNNLALLGPPAKARRLLRRLHGSTAGGARIVGGSLDPHQTDDPDHLAYHGRNRARGRPAGQLRVRVRYRRLATPWLDLVFLAPHELRELVEGTGWHVRKVIEGAGPLYVAVLEKDA